MSGNESRTPAGSEAPRPVMGRPNPMGMMMPGQKAKNFRKTMGQLLVYLRPFWLSIIVVVFFAIASTIAAIAAPKILGHMTNQLVSDFVRRSAYDQLVTHIPAGTRLQGITGAQLLARLPPASVASIQPTVRATLKGLDLSVRPSFDYHALGKVAVELFVLYCLSTLFSYVQGWMMSGVSQKITYRFRQDIAAKIGRLPLRYFDARTHGEILSRVTNDVDTVSQTLNQSLTQIITSFTMIIGVLIMMLTISWQMTLVAVVILPLCFTLLGLIVKRSQGYFKQQQAQLGRMNGHVEEMYGGHAVMKVFNGKERSVATFRTINEKLYDSGWKSQFLSGLLFPLITFIGNLGFVGVTVVGGWLALSGKVNIGDIQAFIQYLNQFNQPIIQAANTASVLQSTAAAAERVFEFLSEAEEPRSVLAAKPLADVRGAVEFDHVVFGYSADKTVIRDFTVKVEPGQRVAIVGPTGAGKTTIVNLLMRFYDVNGGRIRIDGEDIASKQREDVRRLFGMVLQDTWLFNGTIRENLSYSKPEASESEIIEAARAAHADHFIRALPQGYEMVLDEEASNISQGEKQLLTIARAMLVRTPMLILDEATSSVDTRTEVLIQRAMDRLMKGKTSFVIAHRLSTIRTADLILVMRDGNIVEQGRHEELLAMNGFYTELYNSQFASPVVAA